VRTTLTARKFSHPASPCPATSQATCEADAKPSQLLLEVVRVPDLRNAEFTSDHPLFLITSPYKAHCVGAYSAKREWSLFYLSLSHLFLAYLHSAPQRNAPSQLLLEVVRVPDLRQPELTFKHPFI